MTQTHLATNNPSLAEPWLVEPSSAPKTAYAQVVKEDYFLKERVRVLASTSSLEMTPRGAAKVESFRDLLEEEGTMRIFITFLPGSDLGETTKTAVRLAGEGFRPVPHIAARSLESEAQLEDALKAWRQEADVEEVLLIGGAVAKPLGPFSESMHVLRTGLLEKHGIKKVGFAAHPEGSPDITHEACVRAIAEKNDYIKNSNLDGYFVTQFFFEMQPVLRWLEEIRQKEKGGNRLKVVVGLPGLATLKTLITHAHHCGIGNSMRLLLKRAKDVRQLMTTRAPDDLIVYLAQAYAKDQKIRKYFDGIHLFPLGGIGKTAAWRKKVAEGDFQLKGDGLELEELQVSLREASRALLNKRLRASRVDKAHFVREGINSPR